jgi:hypothetical protein
VCGIRPLFSNIEIRLREIKFVTGSGSGFGAGAVRVCGTFAGFFVRVNAGRFFWWLFRNACSIVIENTVTVSITTGTGIYVTDTCHYGCISGVTCGHCTVTRTDRRWWWGGGGGGGALKRFRLSTRLKIPVDFNVSLFLWGLIFPSSEVGESRSDSSISISSPFSRAVDCWSCPGVRGDLKLTGVLAIYRLRLFRTLTKIKLL